MRYVLLSPEETEERSRIARIEREERARLRSVSTTLDAEEQDRQLLEAFFRFRRLRTPHDTIEDFLRSRRP